MVRIPASERTRERLKALMDGQSEEGDLRSALVRLAARLIVEEGLEGEATDALGREYYARGAAAGAGYRNGYRRGRLKTAEGVVEYAAPQICNRAVPFHSRLREIIRGRTEELEALAVEMYARGLSTRDIEALFADEDGRSLLSRTAVSEVTERLWAEYEAFASRDLSEFEVIYLFVDGIAERLHLGQPREAVLAAWGVLADGHKVLLHLAPGSKEDTASCREFFQDMRRRGLPDPLLVISDGAPGLIRAIEECFPRSARQRCLAHKLRNLQSKLPAGAKTRLIHGDSTKLEFADAAYDQVLLFFLLHEQPLAVRRRTLAEAMRVVKPGGKVVLVDYHRPYRWHPLRPAMRAVLRRLEPFALDLWDCELEKYLPNGQSVAAVRKETYFGGLYQKVVLTR